MSSNNAEPKEAGKWTSTDLISSVDESSTKYLIQELIHVVNDLYDVESLTELGNYEIDQFDEHNKPISGGLKKKPLFR